MPKKSREGYGHFCQDYFNPEVFKFHHTDDADNSPDKTLFTFPMMLIKIPAKMRRYFQNKVFSLFSFLLDQKRNKKVKSAGIPPHNRVRIACRHGPPRASWLPIHVIFRFYFSNDAGKFSPNKADALSRQWW